MIDKNSCRNSSKSFTTPDVAETTKLLCAILKILFFVAKRERPNLLEATNDNDASD